MKHPLYSVSIDDIPFGDRIIAILLRTYLVRCKDDASRDRYELNSVDMVRFIYQTCGWEKNSTYRIRGIAVPERNMVVFDLLYEVSHE